MTETSDTHRGGSRFWWIAPVVVACAAVVMGLPTLEGSFVGGDDHRLLLNHVLVNHPSLEHALEIFTIWHRDLYQPLPLLSFQAEFAVANTFGLFDEGLEGGQWLFHLTNILLHAFNAVLVWLVIASLQERAEERGGLRRAAGEEPVVVARRSPASRAYRVATITALLFAVHPFQTEVVAWTNGRMMLLSTLFALLSLLSFSAWMDRPRAGSAVWTIVWVLLCAISKVRICLPVLLLIVFLARRAKLSGRLLTLWAVSALVTGVFVVINVMSTSEADLFSEAAEHLRGPRLVRVLVALAFYAQHLVWPVGLSSYYPTPPLVQWSDAATWHAVLVMVPTLAFAGLACWRLRVARLGVLWFLAAIGATLPLIPARNTLAADRYMYLPIIGLIWLLAMLGSGGYDRWLAGRSVRLRRGVVTVLGGAVVVSGIAMCHHIAWFYATPLRKTQRIASLFPTTPRVWERVGWTHYSAGQYHVAYDCGRKELPHESRHGLCGAYQLMGMSQLRLGHVDNGLELLRQAIEIAPEIAVARNRLGMAMEDLGRTAEAIEAYTAVVEMTPLSNPTIDRLAAAYHRLGDTAMAREWYEKALANNPGYEVPAILGLAEMDIEEGTEASFLAAVDRLEALLAWMPEHSAAWANLGVARRGLGRSQGAIRAYRRALDEDSDNTVAALNLAQVYLASGDSANARHFLERARLGGLDSVQQAIVCHEFYVAEGAREACLGLWAEVTQRFPGAMEPRVFTAWSLAVFGDYEGAAVAILRLEQQGAASPLAVATLALVALEEARYRDATSHARELASRGAPGGDARRRLLGALERFEPRRPDCAWIFCMAARLLAADDRTDAAIAFVGLCEQRCNDEVCTNEVRSLREGLGAAP